MGKISRSTLVKNYHKIFDCIYDTPTVSIIDIAATTRLSRNTVSKYLRLMYETHVMIGPEIRMRSSEDYKEYVYLLKFHNPGEVFRRLKGFPHVVYHGLATGHWNIMVVTNRLLDFSKLVGFQSVVYQDVKYCSYTPKVDNISWHSSFEKMHEYVDAFRRRHEEKIRRFAPPLKWGHDEWALYQVFNRDMRKKVAPTLNKSKLRYEAYSRWFKDIETHCTIHTGFYPDKYATYLSHCFLIYTNFEESVKSLFSFLPTSSSIVEVGNCLLVFTNAFQSDITRSLFCTLYDMETKGILKKFYHAVALYHIRG
jgi:hypothetical protein